MEQFKRFEEEFINSSRIIGRSMRNLENANGNVDLVIAASVEIEGELSECEGYLKAMEIEYRNLGQLDKKSVQGKVNEYKEEYALLNSRYTQSKFNAESLALKGGNNARNKLLNANQRLDQSTATLEQARMLVAQTENIGTTIITDLEGQKEQLMGAHEKVKETRQFTLDAKNILRIMGNRAIMHKCCVMFTMFALLVVIGVIIYYGFLKDKK